ncbi:four-helix bundle copper-binding protein [Amphibacillus cookii]|uniref:four-helix bundle copper-binding protein n=1 Tax=Amphibacillus cookii TaxID=767787 RepID=UPI001958D420|nr:four-helix bundle copper-binding protein [Amphibacillus cookii]MBM7540094.1 hypothetical protein [Amphibacillus cookii]
MNNAQYQSVVIALQNCREACLHCYRSCFKEDANHMAKCIQMSQECATICAQFEQALFFDTQFIESYAKLCIEACQVCGYECAKHEHDHCQDCAKACYACADACKGLLDSRGLID